MSILEKLAKPEVFQPASDNEYVALQLARQLNDTDNIHWYVRSIECFGQDRVFSALQAVQSIVSGERAAAFRSRIHH
jgi:hypothetical protein